MKLDYKDVLNKHTNIPAVVAAHGPSLNKDKNKIEQLQEEGKIIRLSLNNWFYFFDSKPDYWILASSVDTVKSLMKEINEYNVPIFFADTVDNIKYSFIEENINADYFGYDQKHFKGHTCVQILSNFSLHYLKNEYSNFKYYGNNDIMWQPPRFLDGAGFSRAATDCFRIQDKEIIAKEMNQVVHGNFDIEWAHPKIKRLTIQEQLQKISGFESHYSTGDTVALHAIAFAIIMGCNPIYVSGMDLNYNKGYAESNVKNPNGISWRFNNDWKSLQKNLLNDLHILNESAKKRNIKIINLNKDAWFNEFKKADIID
tara:strand:- start:8886 stop:9827 length:942 start_codon:yes stop_codon:yes gene_type:complete